MRAASHSGIPEAESLLLAWPRHRRGKFGIEIEGFAAKRLRTKGKKAMEINWAGVLELVDRRDLKSPGATEITHLHDLTWPGNPHEAGGDPAVLSNTPSLFRAGWQALENVGRVFLPNRRKARTRACEPARRLPGFDRSVRPTVADTDVLWLFQTISSIESVRSAPASGMRVQTRFMLRTFGHQRAFDPTVKPMI